MSETGKNYVSSIFFFNIIDFFYPYTIVSGIHKMAICRIAQLIAFFPRSQYDSTQPNGQNDDDFGQVEHYELAFVLSQSMIDA